MRNSFIFIAVVFFLLYPCQQADGKAAGKKGKRIKKPTPLLTDHLGRQIPEVDQMVEWIKSNGGLANVLIRDMPGKGRMAVTSKHIPKGSVLAAVPKSLCFSAPNNLAPAYLWSEVKDAGSKLAPYLRTLPARSQVWSYYTIPERYLPLIQNDAVESAIRSMQGSLQQMWDLDGDIFKREIGQDMTYDDLAYAMSLLETRTFAFADPDGELMVPLLDMTNHHNGCPHTISAPTGSPCPPGSAAKDCVVWQAGADIPAGSEVCYSYSGYMLQDQAVLQYGFLQDGDAAAELSGLDRHDFDPQQPLTRHYHKPKPFSGTSADIKAEITRLQLLQEGMTQFGGTKLEEEFSRDEELDSDGHILQVLLTWRQQRQAAIAAELRRLQHLLEHHQPCGIISSWLGRCKTS